MNPSLLASAPLDDKFPRVFIYAIVAICASPALLNLLGFDFSSVGTAVDHAQLEGNALLEAEFQALSGAFTHTILEWSAFCIAVFVALLSFSYYKATGDVTTPIIGVAFFMAGCMDAFHTLAADRLIEAVADNRDLVPFTWAISRIFNALILIAGVVLLLISHRLEKDRVRGTGFVIGIGFVFGIVAYIIINVSATSTQLPATTFPDAVLTRPYDALPLVLFIISGVYIYPLLFKRYPSLFSHALILSAIPQVATQLHMTFGSTALFDNHFNIGHFLKIVAYAVPLAGLSLDFVRSQQKLKDSENRQRSTVDTLFDGVITINGNGIIQSFNKAAIDIFGFTAEEVIGENIKILMPEPYRSEHDSYLQHFKDTNEARIIGIGREVIGQRKDGNTFPMELGVREFWASDQFMFTGIIRDMTEIKEAERIKSQFISTVSHELRTPLTSIRGALGLVLGKESDRLSDRARSMLEVANRNSERLTLLINDILDLEKLEANQIEFNLVSTDLVKLAKQAIIDNEAYAQQHQTSLVKGPMPEQAIVYGDELRLAQVFSNLISNAVKYSPKDGEVEISITQHEGGYSTAVRDHGSGIPEEFHDRIFQRFAQADSSDTREKGGTGLGLSITKAIVERHRGHIKFESEPGAGTVFSFYLPASIQNKQVKQRPAPASRVLICEDDVDVAEILAQMLRGANIDSDIAEDATTTRELLSRNDYCLLLLDLKLPDIDGLQLLRELRAEPETAELPVIVVSARAEEGRKAFNGDAVTVIDWIQKPVDQQRFSRAIQQVLLEDGVRPHILHVEDDPDIVQLVQALLEDVADLSFASSVEDGHEKLSEQNFDLVILDLGLADGSGVELLDDIKGRCPVVIFSAQTPNQSITAQVTAALTKTTTTNEQLLATIKKLLQG